MTILIAVFLNTAPCGVACSCEHCNRNSCFFLKLEEVLCCEHEATSSLKMLVSASTELYGVIL